MNSSQALSLQNNAPQSGMASMYWPPAIDANVLMQFHKMGSLGAYVFSPTSCMVFGTGNSQPDLVLVYTLGELMYVKRTLQTTAQSMYQMF
jgi:hypothetical protein